NGDGDGGAVGDDGGAAHDGGGGGGSDGGGGNGSDGGSGGNDGGPCLPSPEVCNHLDDDCDGTPDDGFNLQGDPSNCGDCGVVCEYSHAFGVCNTGTCERGDCFPGWVDDPTVA